jgi:hypothetical protein
MKYLLLYVVIFCFVTVNTPGQIVPKGSPFVTNYIPPVIQLFATGQLSVIPEGLFTSQTMKVRSLNMMDLTGVIFQCQTIYSPGLWVYLIRGGYM